MAHSPPWSPSPSPGRDVSSPDSSSISGDDLPPHSLDFPDSISVSRPGSPPNGPTTGILEMDGEDSMSCQWEECGKIFNHLPSLIDHIHNDHIGVHKSNYTCEWKTCPRRGIAQTSRFALISHIRSHTGEKPFICPRPECDKSFTRSDALAKHMRIQHNITPPAPGRGGNRKRKREEPEPVAQPSDGYGTFKVDPPDTGEFEDRMSPFDVPNDFLNGAGVRRSVSPEGDGENEDDTDDIPEYLKAQEDPATGLILGRPPAMVKYLLLKAKYQYALEEHSNLIQELRSTRYEEKCWRDRKDALLDEVLRATFGPQAEDLVLKPADLVGENGRVPSPVVDS